MRLSITLLVLLSLHFCVTLAADPVPADKLLHHDDFDHGLADWAIELQKGGSVTANAGRLDIDVPEGCTVWFRHELAGPVAIEYEATAISAGGVNDRVSDINSFWMATDPQSASGSPLEKPRSGTFADYNNLLTYYVGLGGNGNTTTRFRRYIGDKEDRPLLPEHDLREPKFLLKPNEPTRLRLVADGKTIEYYRDGQRLFVLDDPHPYVRGWFGFRTTKSHLRIRSFRVMSLAKSVVPDAK